MSCDVRRRPPSRLISALTMPEENAEVSLHPRPDRTFAAGHFAPRSSRGYSVSPVSYMPFTRCVMGYGN